MSGPVTDAFLEALDRHRRAGGETSARGGIVREHADDGSECRVVHARCAPGELDDAIRDEIERAGSAGYTLEWKVYGHDALPGLPARLVAAGFEPGAPERVLVLPVTREALAAFGPSAHEIRRIHDAGGLDDVATIARQIGRANADEERQRLASTLRQAPGSMSVHVAYVDGEPVASGRVHFKDDSAVAELAGGRTMTTHRRRGLFTALVAARLREALERGCTHLFVDALPTSEPILVKRGFRPVTTTQPFVYDPVERVR